MEKNPSVWVEKFQIDVANADHRGHATLTAFCDFFQNGASRHYYSVVKNHGKVLEKNEMWLLSRMEIHIDHFLKYEDETTLTTWSRGVEKLFALRDFSFTGPENISVAKGSSSWLIVDIKSRRIVRPDLFLSRWPVKTGESAIGKNASKIDAPVAPHSGNPFNIRYSDLDLNGHVNNVKYVEWRKLF